MIIIQPGLKQSADQPCGDVIVRLAKYVTTILSCTCSARRVVLVAKERAGDTEYASIFVADMRLSLGLNDSHSGSIERSVIDVGLLHKHYIDLLADD